MRWHSTLNSGGSALRIRIIQISESWGGMEHNNTQLAARLSSRGHHVGITTIGNPAYSLMPDRYRGMFELEEIPWDLRRLPSFFGWAKLMRSRPADIAILPKNWWAKGGLPLVWAAAANYPRVILREHVPVPVLPRPMKVRSKSRIVPSNLWWHRHLLYGRMLSLLPKRIICVSDTVRRRLVEQCAFPSDRTVTVHNGIDASIFRRDDEAGIDYRRAHGVPPGAVVFGAVGRLNNTTKRHDWSLRAFARLAAERRAEELHFLLVGAGDDERALREMAAELKIGDRFTLAPFTSEPLGAYNALDVFLMPSAFEAFGLALAEAMACERCTVSVPVDGLAEIMSEPDIGLSAASEEGLYQSMVLALEMGPCQRAAMGSRARASVVRRFDADRQYERIMALVVGQPEKHDGAGRT